MSDPLAKLKKPIFEKASIDQQIEELLINLGETDFLEPRVRDFRYSRIYWALKTLLFVKEHEDGFRAYIASLRDKVEVA